MHLSTPSVQAVLAVLTTHEQAEPTQALDRYGNSISSTRVLRLTLTQIAAAIQTIHGRRLSLNTIARALQLLRQKGVLITLRSHRMGDVAGHHLLCETAQGDDLCALVRRYKEFAMPDHDYRALPVFMPKTATVMQESEEYDISGDCPFDFPAQEAPLDPVVVPDTLHTPEDAAEVPNSAPTTPLDKPLTRKQLAEAKRAEKAAEKAAVLAEKEAVKAAHKAELDKYTDAARLLVDFYTAYLTERQTPITYGLVWTKCKDMAKCGITVDDLKTYLDHLSVQRNTYERLKAVKIAAVAQEIGVYLRERRNSPQFHPPVIDGIDHNGRFDYRLSKAYQDDLDQRAAESKARAEANGGVDPGEDKTESMAKLEAYLQACRDKAAERQKWANTPPHLRPKVAQA